MYTKIERLAIRYLAGNQASSASGTALRAALEEKYPGAIARAQEALKQERSDARFVGTVPPWMKRLVERHGRNVTRFAVRRGGDTRWNTSGHCKWDGDITLTVARGEDERETRSIVLHEIAHANKPYAQHDARFYKEWRRMLVAEGLLRYAIDSNVGQGARSLRAAGRKAA